MEVGTITTAVYRGDSQHEPFSKDRRYQFLVRYFFQPIPVSDWKNQIAKEIF